jgi:ring-1,2-phenylacetyl-CoA epoxidase subunit PaaE
MASNQVLTDEEVADGLVLTCQAVPSSSKVVVNYDDV